MFEKNLKEEGGLSFYLSVQIKSYLCNVLLLRYLSRKAFPISWFGKYPIECWKLRRVLLALSFIFLAKPILKTKFALYLIFSLWVSRQCGLGNANRLKMVDHATSCLSCNESFEFGEVAARQKDELRRIVVEWSIGLLTHCCKIWKKC